MLCYPMNLIELAMKSFIDRNPKEKAVEEAFAGLACNGYQSDRPDPADDVFLVAERLKRQQVQGETPPCLKGPNVD